MTTGTHDTSETPVTSVAQLDLARYAGLWYELGRLPLRFEDDNARDVTAEYTAQDDGNIRVDNRCLDDEGTPTQAIGEAVPDPEHAGRLRVTFLPAGLRWIPFTHADYWVLRIDPAYEAALVGTPDRKFLWLLSRKPHLDPAQTAEYLATAKGMGFDLAPWITTEQSGRRVSDSDLATSSR